MTASNASSDHRPTGNNGLARSPADLAVLDEILATRELIFVTGKGGVGKSVVAAALALRAKDLGLTPLLFECDAPPRPSLFPGGRAPRTDVAEVSEGILGVNQTSDDAVKQYALAAIPSKAIAEVLLENRISRLFLRASPSVNEMALVGRMVQLVDEHTPKGPVIVDLHATGHALAMLRAPDGIMRVLRAGPVYDRAKVVRDVTFNHERTCVIPVAIPEELPVTEVLEFIDALVEMNVPIGPVMLNAVMTDPAPGVPDSVVDALTTGATARAAQDLRALRRWAARADRERARLIDGVGDLEKAVVALPYVFDVPDSGTLAGQLGNFLRGAPASDGGGA